MNFIIKSICLNPEVENISKREYRHEVYCDGEWVRDFADKEDARDFIDVQK